MKSIDKINNMLELPKEICLELPKIAIIGFEEMTVENYQGVLEYEDFYIKLKTKIGTININGIGLKLEKITEENLKVKGKINSINIE